jgi:hypothetical protein
MTLLRAGSLEPNAFGNALGNSIVGQLRYSEAEKQRANQADSQRVGEFGALEAEGQGYTLNGELVGRKLDEIGLFRDQYFVGQEIDTDLGPSTPSSTDANSSGRISLVDASGTQQATKEVERLNDIQQVKQQVQQEIADRSSLSPDTRAATLVRGKDGRIFRHDKFPDENGRFLFVKDPITDPERSAFSGELGLSLGLFESRSQTSIPLLDQPVDGGRFGVLQSTSGVALETTLNKEGLRIAAGASTNSELIYGGRSFNTPLGDVSIDVRSAVDLRAEGRLAIDSRGRSIDAALQVGAYASSLQAIGRFFSKDVDLFFFDAKVAGQGQLDALAGGGVLGGGVTVRGGRVRLFAEAGAATLFGGRGRLDVDVGPNESFTTNLLDGIDDFRSGRAALPEIVSRPSINPLAPSGAVLGDWLFRRLKDRQ